MKVAYMEDLVVKREKCVKYVVVLATYGPCIRQDHLCGVEDDAGMIIPTGAMNPCAEFRRLYEKTATQKLNNSEWLGLKKEKLDIAQLVLSKAQVVIAVPWPVFQSFCRRRYGEKECTTLVVGEITLL